MRFLVFLIFVTSVSNSQIKAVTENGDEVVLYDDKSWKFINENINNEFDSSKNYPVFYHDENSTFLLKSNINDVGVMIDPKKWSFNKSATDDSEFEFELKNESLYGLMINEKMEIPLETLKESAFYNFDFAANDANILEQEYRYINDLLVLKLHMQGTIDGLSVYYYGYYFSGDKGTTQFVTYSTSNLFELYKNEAELLLNGLVELN